ncbi:hypothetical protein BJ170DRAFT_671326 [Xylariales sp. AK1849]|nr:hypothetical protein BJ170DRAFT_671326 [Xylariales sp. AK1849]
MKAIIRAPLTPSCAERPKRITKRQFSDHGSLASLPKDFLVTHFQFTRTVYSDQYPSIDPAKPELNLAGKVVIVTGASSGIGARGFAPAFVKAGIKGLVLLATDARKLEAVEDQLNKINPSVRILTVTANVTDEKSLVPVFNQIKSTFGQADILINNAGLSNATDRARIGDEDPLKWWSNIEVNGLGTFLMTQAFIRQLPTSETPATIINLTSGAAWAMNPESGAYGMSKLVSQQLTLQTAATYPNITAVALNPGLVETDMMPKDLRDFNFETPELAGGWAVWLCHPHASFLTGRAVSSNWSVDHLLERKEDVLAGKQLTMDFVGPFGPGQFE